MPSANVHAIRKTYCLILFLGSLLQVSCSCVQPHRTELWIQESNPPSVSTKKQFALIFLQNFMEHFGVDLQWRSHCGTSVAHNLTGSPPPTPYFLSHFPFFLDAKLFRTIKTPLQNVWKTFSFPGITQAYKLTAYTHIKTLPPPENSLLVINILAWTHIYIYINMYIFMKGRKERRKGGKKGDRESSANQRMMLMK